MILSLRTNLTLQMAALLIGSSVILGGVAFWRAQATVSDLTGRIISHSSSSIANRVDGLLGIAESNGKVLAGLVSPTISNAPVLSDSSSFLTIASKMIDLIKANQELGSVSYTLDRTGEFVRVIQKPSGQVTVQMSRLGDNSNWYYTEQVPFGNTLQLESKVQTKSNDFRKEDWYQRAKSSAHADWTDTYLFQNRAFQKSPATSYVRPVYNRKNKLLGVVTVDFAISDLSRFLQTITVGRNGYAALLEYGKAGSPQVIAYPQQNRLFISESRGTRLASLNEIDDPALSALAKTIGANQVQLTPGKVERLSANAKGQKQLLGYMRIQGEHRPRWILAVIVPEGDFMSGVWQTGASLAVIFCLLLAGVIFVSSVVAQRVAEPLQSLAHETELIRSLDLASREPILSHVIEINDLNQAMEHMKTGLRSLEKLVPADYARWLIVSGQEAKLGGERRHITTYFGDIIGFTALSERMEPEELVDILAEYLDVLSGEVLKHGGTVDKFNGDDVMAFWGAPNRTVDHAYLACKSALRSQDSLRKLHGDWDEKSLPHLSASFGISTGDVIVGNVGSRQRMNYTVIGDAVNLASRLQGLNKYYSTEILVSDQTIEEAGDKIVSRLVDWVAVVGRDEPVPVHELLGLRPETHEFLIELAHKHNQAMQLYKIREFREAQILFAENLEIDQHDGPTRILFERCERYLESPPGPNWNGAMQMQVK